MAFSFANAFQSAAAGYKPPVAAKLPTAPRLAGPPKPQPFSGGLSGYPVKPPSLGGDVATSHAGGQAPAAPAASSSSASSPLDSTYFANVAANQAKINSQIAGLNQQQGFDQTGLQSQLAQLAHQEPLDQLKLEQAANARGALYSTPYAQQQGQLAYDYLGRQGAAQDNYAKAAAAIASKIAGLQQDEPLYEGQQAADAAVRASNAAAKNPGLGTDTNSPTAASLVPAPQVRLARAIARPKATAGQAILRSALASVGNRAGAGF